MGDINDDNQTIENEISLAIPLKHLSAANISNVKLAVYASATNATFKTIDTKLHAPVVTLSTEYDKRLLEKLRTWFKITIKFNKYRSEMTNQTKNNNLS